ncbi:MAG: hypothetical protein WDO73_05765 [Ignavibacteriota bacterium]
MGDLKIEGYLNGKLAATRTLPGGGTDDVLVVKPDDNELNADGSDATRVVLAVMDSGGNYRPFATGAISLSLTGPGEIVGENPFSLSGGGGRSLGESQGVGRYDPPGSAPSVPREEKRRNSSAGGGERIRLTRASAQQQSGRKIGCRCLTIDGFAFWQPCR